MQEINDPDAALDIAIEHHQSGRLAEAEALYRRILEADPGHPGALYFLGGIVYQNGAYDEAFALIDEVLRGEPNDPEALHLLGLIEQRLGRPQQAIESIGKALLLAPQYAHAHASLAGLLRDTQRYDAALNSYDRAIALQADFAEAHCGRGLTLIALGKRAPALASFEAAVAAKADYAEAHLYRGNTLDDLRRYEEAAQAYAQALQWAPEMKYALGKKLGCELQICDWQNYALDGARIRAAVREKKLVIEPFSFLAISPSPAEQLTCASSYVADQYAPQQPLWQGEIYRHEKIRIAYLSADFHSHATAFLMAKFFELHDRSRFEVTAFSFGPNVEDEMRARLRRAFDRFIDVRACSDAQIAAQLRAEEIDIAIDLKGLTGGSRLGVFERRPAPIQVLYMGYPGTLGAQCIDYMIADEVVIPRAEDEFYAEKIVRLPETYWSTDDEMQIAAHTPGRAELGLPENSFVFCCFNNNYKIAPPIFDIWMRLLDKVEGSVLWLLEDNAAAVANLRNAARQRGIAAERLLFAPRRPLAEHLARQRRADLFLDTLPVNAHTTTSDALWAGLPVLTCRGDAFVGRVAASLLKAIGLPELIAENLPDYEALALQLATTPALLGELRAKLARNRTTQPLFDSDRFRRHFEAAYLAMYQRYRQGLAPAALDVAALPAIDGRRV